MGGDNAHAIGGGFTACGVGGQGLIVRTILVLLLLVGIGWWWTGLSSDELVTYRASCTNEIHILPRSLAMRGKPFEQAFKKYRADRTNCGILLLGRTVYKLNKARGEVYYTSNLSGTQRLVDCAIFSRTDWACSYPDGSGKVVIIDGLRAIHADDVNWLGGPHFSLRRWQWWGAKFYWWIGQPRGAWLIPEQHEYI